MNHGEHGETILHLRRVAVLAVVKRF